VPDEATRDSVGCELIADSLRRGREVSFRVMGSSMLPSILPGDELTVRPLEEVLPRSGEIVVFVRERKLFAHRMIAKSERAGNVQRVTRGDALIACDRPVEQSEVLGSVVRISRGGREISVASCPNHLISLGLRHSALLRRIVLDIHAARRPSGANAETR
jgi:hypothetical protein